MTDFVGRVLRPEKDDWIIRSPLDIDFYKFTMGLFIFRFHKGTDAKSGLINRNKKIPLAAIIDERELRAQLDHVRTLRLSRTDRIYLRGQDVYGTNMFPEDYLEFLGRLQMTPYRLERKGDQFELTVEGPWEVVTFWETIILAIISELFYRTLMREMTKQELGVLYGRATDKLYGKLKRIKERPSIRFADFGQRRRHSFLWQQHAVEMCQEVLGEDQFVGTSNTWMAFNKNLVPIGTNAHELPMALTALALGKKAQQQAQYEVLREWGNLFPQNALRIMLPDTYGSAQFFKNMPDDLAEEVARTWRGQRQDSGDPVKKALEYIEWLAKYGVNAKEKLNIPSDGLDVDEMFRIDEALAGRIGLSFGWGTLLTNDFIDCHPLKDEKAVVRGRQFNLTCGELFRGHSIVFKLLSIGGTPAVKLSNNPAKATGPRFEVEKYLKLFGHEGMAEERVIV